MHLTSAHLSAHLLKEVESIFGPRFGGSVMEWQSRDLEALNKKNEAVVLFCSERMNRVILSSRKKKKQEHHDSNTKQTKMWYKEI